MAGIGFELKKLFAKKGLFANTRAALYSTLVTVGPTIICIFMMVFFNWLLKINNIRLPSRQLFQGIILYSFVFSLILTSGYSIILSRYLADRIYEEKYEDIKASLYGSITLIMIIASIVAIIFYWNSQLNLFYKIFAYILFIENVIEIILCTYVTALKNCRIIALGFIIGFLLSILLGSVLMAIINVDPVLIALVCFDIGFLIVILVLCYEIQRYFTKDSGNYFGFICYFKKYYLLFFTNLFYILGLYVHNFIFWTIPEMNMIVGETYVFSPSYDIVAFYALLTTLPTTIIFVVKVETAIFSRYREYFYCINQGASYKDIEIAKIDMKKSIYNELSYLLYVQIIFTIGSIVFGNRFLPFHGFTSSMISTFNILTLAYYGIIMLFVITTLLLYFDDRIGACLITLGFLILNFILTYVSTLFGEVYYGFGTFIVSFIAICVSIKRLAYFLNNIDYYVFCKNSSWK